MPLDYKRERHEDRSPSSDLRTIWFMSPRFVFDALLGFLRLGIATRFRVRGPYWRWRMETAFGLDPALRPSRARMIRLAFEYAAWTTRMRRLR